MVSAAEVTCRHESGPGDRTLADGRGATHARDGSTAAGARHREAGHRHAERGGHRRRPCLEECRHRAARAAKDLTLQRGDVSCRRVPKAWISLRLWGSTPRRRKNSYTFREKKRNRSPVMSTIRFDEPTFSCLFFSTVFCSDRIGEPINNENFAPSPPAPPMGSVLNPVLPPLRAIYRTLNEHINHF